ncbi:MAG: DinB family protein [Gemmataceae bacterium]
MSNIAALIEKYESTPAELRAMIRGMTKEQLTARPVAGKMSTLEVVAHIADFEPVLADRMRRVAALDKPLLVVADENEFLKKLGYHNRDVELELNLIEGTRKATAAILKSLPAEAFARQGVHSLKGLQSLEQVLTAAANHIAHHMVFIAEKKKALGIG